MDKFLQRQPTWKTTSYEATRAAANNAAQKKQLAASCDAASKRRPLQEHPGLNAAQSQPTSTSTAQEQLKRKHTELINKFRKSIAVNSDENEHFQDVPSSAPSLEKPQGSATSKPLSKLRDVATTPKILTAASVSKLRDVATPLTPTAKQTPFMERLQRDLNSPSASCRARALQALRTPLASNYDNFDVPHAEQSIITAEERQPAPPPTLPDILKDVIVYVEVRTGLDNRSEGVKTIIAKLGAKVNDRLRCDTTHVVFKDGLLATYKKASKWNIPVVSILWIEACKVQRKICDPDKFPISNKHLYEYPELYPKLSRVRCIQPDSELHRRRKRPATPTTPKEAEAPITPASKQKSGIARFFKPQGSHGKQIRAIDGDVEATTESPATKLLNRISNGCFTPLQSAPLPPSEAPIREEEDKAETETETEQVASQGSGDAIAMEQPVATISKPLAQRSLSYNEQQQERGDEQPQLQEAKKPLPKSRRSSAEPTPTSRRRSSSSSALEPRMTRRRSSMHVASSMAGDVAPPTPEPRLTRRRSLQLISAAIEEEKSQPQKPPQLSKKPSFQAISEEPPLAESVGDNKTIYMEAMDMNVTNEEPVAAPKTPRRTLNTSQSMEISEIRFRSVTTSNTGLSEVDEEEMELTITAKISQFIAKAGHIQANATTQTALSEDDNYREEAEADLEEGQLTPVPIFSSTRLPGSSNNKNNNNRRRSLFNVTMDLVNERINSINKLTPKRTSDNSLLLLQAQQANEMELGECRKTAKRNLEREEEMEEPQAEFHSLLSTSKENLAEPAQTSQPKMRKLFNPNQEIVYSPPRSSKKPRLSISSPASVPKRRRTLGATPAKTKLVEPKATKDTKDEDETQLSRVIIKKILARRSTLDFEPVKNKVEEVAGAKKKLEEAAVAKKKLEEEAVAKKKLEEEAVEVFVTPTDSEEVIKTKETDKQLAAKRRRSRLRTLVHTNMHHEQIQVIHKAIRKLRGIRLDQTVTKRTTHLVSLEPRRTLNLLRGLMRGVWIINYGWILESLRAGKWVDEEHYEMKIFSRAVEICRTERQAFGEHYRCELFRFMEAFYVSSLCRPIQYNNVKELLLLGCAKLTENRFKAKFIIGDKRRAEDDRIYLSPGWVLDSITTMQIQKFGRYLMQSAIVTPVGIIYENPKSQLPPHTYKDFRDPELIIEK